MSTKGTITSVWIGDTGVGFKSFMINITHETGASQGYGGYTLDRYDEDVGGRVNTPMLELMLRREVPKILNRKDWDDLVGTQVDIEGTFNQIQRIGVNNNWVDLKDLFEPYRTFYSL